MSTDLIRRGTLTDLAASLRSQRTRAVDVVVPAASLNFDGSTLNLTDVPVSLDDNGVTDPNGLFVPTRVAIEGIASKLNVSARDLKRFSMEHADIFAHVVNNLADRDSESRYLLRLLKSDDPTDAFGTLRAVLSDRYRTIDNFDVLLAVLAGLKESGVEMPKIDADLTEERMHVRVHSESVAVNAAALIGDYRSPYSGNTGVENPLLFAGFVVSNSDVGKGAFSLTPRAVFQVCTNGMTVTKDAFKKVHLGGALTDGVIKWSDDTIAAQLRLVTAQAKDAVSTFLSGDYWETKVREIEKDHGVPVEEPAEVIKAVSKTLGFTEDVATDLLNAFIDGGIRTAGGVMQAVTAVAQKVDNGDDAADMESKALEALHLAAHPRALARATR